MGTNPEDYPDYSEHDYTEYYEGDGLTDFERIESYIKQTKGIYGKKNKNIGINLDSNIPVNTRYGNNRTIDFVSDLNLL